VAYYCCISIVAGVVIVNGKTMGVLGIVLARLVIGVLCLRVMNTLPLMWHGHASMTKTIRSSRDFVLILAFTKQMSTVNEPSSIQ